MLIIKFHRNPFDRFVLRRDTKIRKAAIFSLQITRDNVITSLTPRLLSNSGNKFHRNMVKKPDKVSHDRENRNLDGVDFRSLRSLKVNIL